MEACLKSISDYMQLKSGPVQKLYDLQSGQKITQTSQFREGQLIVTAPTSELLKVGPYIIPPSPVFHPIMQKHGKLTDENDVS